MSADNPLRQLIHNTPRRPGVYCLLDDSGAIVYVGKARRLRDRLMSYLRPEGAKTRALMQRVTDIQVTITRSEGEALLLENNLIKAHRPRYNVLLRDDKSYPWVIVTTDQSFPRVGFYRGPRRGNARYFGPYANSTAVRTTVRELQRLFRLRNCEDSYFNNRSRPCLQYQIDRCSAPCVGYINEADYATDVRNAVDFLEGRSERVIEQMIQRMDEAAGRLEYERAARFRDQVSQLRQMQAQQDISGQGGDLDLIAAVVEQGTPCVAVGFIRNGHNLGYRTHFPRVPADIETEALRAEFIARYYADHPVPPEIHTDGPVEDNELLADVLGERSGRKVRITHRLRGQRRRRIEMLVDNARQALALRLAGSADMERRRESLQQALGLSAPPERLECFDISHTSGEATVGSCVVFNAEGPVKSDYRRFNLRDIEAGDDYAAMEQVLRRRYRRVQEAQGNLPDVILIDGGKGQLAKAEAVIQELGLEGLKLIGVAKGPERKAGREQLFLSGSGVPIILPPESPGLHLVQQIRDEAHRFAITGHRQRRAVTRRTSTLEGIPGVGPQRRRELLRQFGGLQEVQRADVSELARVPGISEALAQRIHASLHPEEYEQQGSTT